MKKIAETSVPIHALLAERWSPRAFQDRDVEPELLTRLFEAARWAPSCFNDQPWRFLVARRDQAEAFERLASCLVPGNAWARQAPVLVLTVAASRFAHNDKPNHHSWHDVGLAAMSLVVQAQAEGLSVHQMAGFDGAKARAALAIPEGFWPVTMIAIGWRGEADGLPGPLAERERGARQRKPLAEILFGAGWDQPFA